MGFRAAAVLTSLAPPDMILMAVQRLLGSCLPKYVLLQGANGVMWPVDGLSIAVCATSSQAAYLSDLGDSSLSVNFKDGLWCGRGVHCSTTFWGECEQDSGTLVMQYPQQNWIAAQ